MKDMLLMVVSHMWVAHASDRICELTVAIESCNEISDIELTIHRTTPVHGILSLDDSGGV